MSRRALVVAVSAAVVGTLAVGCSKSSSKGGGGGPGTWSGSTGAPAFTVQSAIFVPSITIDTAGDTAMIGVLSSAPGLCALLGSNTQPANSDLVLLEFGTVSGTSIAAPTAPGTFTVFTGTGAPSAIVSGSYTADGATCLTTATDGMASGSIDLTSVGSNSVTGSGTGIGMSDGSTLTTLGFSFTNCPALATALTSTTAPTCQ